MTKEEGNTWCVLAAIAACTLIGMVTLLSSCEKEVSINYNRLNESNAVLRANQK